MVQPPRFRAMTGFANRARHEFGQASGTDCHLTCNAGIMLPTPHWTLVMRKRLTCINSTNGYIESGQLFVAPTRPVDRGQPDLMFVQTIAVKGHSS
jgi:hypothetical protein